MTSACFFFTNRFVSRIIISFFYVLLVISSFPQYAEARVSPRQPYSCVMISNNECCKFHIHRFLNGEQRLVVATYRNQQMIDEITISLRLQYDYSREKDRQIIGIENTNYHASSRTLKVKLVGIATSVYSFKIDNDGKILLITR